MSITGNVVTLVLSTVVAALVLWRTVNAKQYWATRDLLMLGAGCLVWMVIVVLTAIPVYIAAARALLAY